MKTAEYTNYNDLPLFLNAKWGPHGNARRFCGERRCDGMDEACRLRRGEGYEVRADEVAKVLGVSPSSGYELMHEAGFPTLRIGSRMVVPKEKFIQWVEKNTAEGDRL